MHVKDYFLPSQQHKLAPIYDIKRVTCRLAMLDFSFLLHISSVPHQPHLFHDWLSIRKMLYDVRNIVLRGDSGSPHAAEVRGWTLVLVLRPPPAALQNKHYCGKTASLLVTSPISGKGRLSSMYRPSSTDWMCMPSLRNTGAHADVNGFQGDVLDHPMS